MWELFWRGLYSGSYHPSGNTALMQEIRNKTVSIEASSTPHFFKQLLEFYTRQKIFYYQAFEEL